MAQGASSCWAQTNFLRSGPSKDFETRGAGFAMGNHVACCGHGMVTEPEVGPGPPPKPQEEETVEISPKGVVEEAKAKDVEEMPPSPTSPTSQEQRQRFGSRVVSSCSLQGIHIDEDGGGVKIEGARLRSGTTHSLTVLLGS